MPYARDLIAGKIAIWTDQPRFILNVKKPIEVPFYTR
jgi:hypothetical protein